METAAFIFVAGALIAIFLYVRRLSVAADDLQVYYDRLQAWLTSLDKQAAANHRTLENTILDRSAAIFNLIRNEGERVCIVYGTGFTNLDPRERMSDEEKLLASMPSLGGEPIPRAAIPSALQTMPRAANETYESLRQRAIEKAARLSEPPKLVEYNLGTSSRERMKKGDQAELHIGPQVLMSNIRLRTEEPFVIQDVKVGQRSVMMAYDNPAHREIVIQETVHVGNRISILVSWPA